MEKLNPIIKMAMVQLEKAITWYSRPENLRYCACAEELFCQGWRCNNPYGDDLYLYSPDGKLDCYKTFKAELHRRDIVPEDKLNYKGSNLVMLHLEALTYLEKEEKKKEEKK